MPTVPQSNLVAVDNLGQNTPSSPAQVGLVVGPCVMGPSTIILDDSINTIVQNFDSGPSSEEAATALVEPSAGTVYQIRTPSSTAGTVSAVTKTAGAVVGTVVDAYGAILVAGADFNGDVLFQGKVEGAELEIIAGGAEATSVVGNHVRLTYNTGVTTGTTLAALITGTPAALALWGATAIGTGASINNSLLSTYAETAGRIGFQALTTGMSAEVLNSGASLPLVVSLVSGNTKVHIQLATNTHSEPILASNAAILIQSALVTLANNNPGLFTSTLAGSGAGELGVLAPASLPFGSSGAMTVSGSPNDAYQVTVAITRPGALGAAAFQVALGTADGQPLFSGTFLMPPGGTFVIPDTGLTLTFSGTFDNRDTFAFSTTAPQSTLSDVITALTYFLTLPELASLIAVAGEIPVVSLPAWVAALGSMANQLEAAHKYCAIMLEYAGPASGQTNAAWATQVAGVLATLSHPRILVFGGEANAEAALPIPQAGRFTVTNGNRFLFARALALPSGVDVADQTLSGAATAVIAAYQTDAAIALAGARSSYFFLLSGVTGVQMDGVMLESPTGDYTRLVIRRVIDEVSFYASIRQATYVATRQQRNADGTLSLNSKLAIQDDLREYLLGLIVTPGNATDIEVNVDGTNTDGRLIITYFVLVNYYIYTINGRVGAVKSLRFTI